MKVSSLKSSELSSWGTKLCTKLGISFTLYKMNVARNEKKTKFLKPEYDLHLLSQNSPHLLSGFALENLFVLVSFHKQAPDVPTQLPEVLDM